MARSRTREVGTGVDSGMRMGHGAKLGSEPMVSMREF